MSLTVWYLQTFTQSKVSDLCFYTCKISLFHNVSQLSFTYVPTLSFLTGGFHFEKAAPMLPFLPEIFRFKMMLVWMSNIYDFFKMVTFFSNPMWKSWRLLPSAIIFIISSWSAAKALIVLELAKEGPRRSLRINAVCIFKPMISAADISG